MSTTKVATTADLKVMSHYARQHLSRHALPVTIDPEGLHTLQIALFGHNLDAGGQMHHRCRVMVKTVGTDTPTPILLDVKATHWTALRTVEQVLATVKTVTG